MFLTNALNLDYKHIESGTLYTLLYVGNVNCDQTVLDENGLPKWEPQACYRNKETGEVFIRRMTEFETKFQLVFPLLEEMLTQDFDELQKLGYVDARTVTRRTIALLGVAKELWSTFPLVKEEQRASIIRALNFADYVERFSEPDTFFATRFDVAHQRLPVLFSQAGATLNTEHGTSILSGFDASEDTTSVVALLMASLASTLREYKFLTAISVDEKDVEEHQQKLEAVISAARESGTWFDKIGITTALPTMEVKVNSFDSAYLEESN